MTTIVYGHKAKPSFSDWIKMSRSIFCTVVVSCTDGSIQEIKDCIFGYGIATRLEMVTKRGCPIASFFFVEKILEVKDFSL